jgi:hypothetical protein
LEPKETTTRDSTAILIRLRKGNTACGKKLSDGKTMDFEKVTRTILKANPNGIRSKKLVDQLNKITGLVRSTILYLLGRMNNVGNLYRENGIYWLEKPLNRESEVTKELVHLAEKIATNAPPYISRDVDLKIGKRRIRIKNA